MHELPEDRIPDHCLASGTATFSIEELKEHPHNAIPGTRCVEFRLFRKVVFRLLLFPRRYEKQVLGHRTLVRGPEGGSTLVSDTGWQTKRVTTNRRKPVCFMALRPDGMWFQIHTAWSYVKEYLEQRGIIAAAIENVLRELGWGNVIVPDQPQTIPDYVVIKTEPEQAEGHDG